MKKTISNTLLLAIPWLFISACQTSTKESEKIPTNEQILQEVTFVKAIGKVIPATDWAIISSPVTARIQRVLVQEGDTVTAGQVLLLLESGTSNLDIAEAQARLVSLQAESRAALADLQKAQLYATELKSTYETSKRLLAVQAETNEVTATDYSNWQQQERIISGQQEKINAQQATEKEQAILIQKAKNQLSDFHIAALKDGIITDLAAKVGQTVIGSAELGRIVDTSHPIIEAEVDELFANDIQVGQQVYLLGIARADTLGEGRVTYSSPILSNKSILYETANESEDRRVRKLHIQPTRSVPLVINAKVACEIKIR